MIRIDNLKLLMRLNSWSPADLARRVRKSDSYISQLLTGKKNFGEKSARSIEERCGKPRYWLDAVHDELDYTSVGNSSENVGVTNDSHSNQSESPALPPQVTHGDDGRLLPVVPWEYLYMLDADNSSRELLACEQAPAYGPASIKAKWIIMPDDSMTAQYHKGCRLKIEPRSHADPGKLIVVKDKHGSFFVRLMRVISDSHFEAHATNPGFGTLDSKRDGLVIVAVVTQALIDC